MNWPEPFPGTRHLQAQAVTMGDVKERPPLEMRPQPIICHCDDEAEQVAV
jgi:hypothetical protein